MPRYRQTRTKRAHEELLPYKRAKLLAHRIYQETVSFPASEQYGLQSQLRRAAVSIISNISEGAARGTRRDFLRFLRTARASLAEVITQIEFCDDLGLLSAETTDDLLRLADNTNYLLNRFINYKRSQGA